MQKTEGNIEIMSKKLPQINRSHQATALRSSMDLNRKNPEETNHIWAHNSILLTPKTERKS